MRNSSFPIRRAFAIATLFVLPSMPLPARAAEAGDATAVASRITDVTIYADRARVTRTGSVAIHSGVSRLSFAKLPGWLDEGSVRVSITPPSIEVADVQVEKTFLAKADDADILKAEAAVTAISDQLAELDDQKAALEAESRQADSIRAFSLDKLPKDAAVREIKPDEYTALVKFVGNTMLDVAARKRDLEKKRRDLQPELRARQQALNDLRQRSQLEQRTIIVSIKAARDGEAKLTFNYLLPGATWEPVQELRAAPDGKSVSVASYAVVTQTTGEDWEGATLTFSSQRPNATAKIPELEALLVGDNHSLGKVVGAEADTFVVAAQNFAVQNRFYNGVANAGRIEVQKNWDDNVRQQQARQVRVGEIFQRVQQRGTTAQFPATGSQTVRTDGQAVRVPIGSWQFASSPHIVAAPELSLNAVQTADLTNSGSQPLLPGKVLLYEGGAFVGTTELDFVAPGEKFSVFLGVADRLKLSRTLDPKRSSLSWSGKRKRMLASFVVTMENLSEQPVTYQLAERVPVSETDEVRVTGVKLLPDAKPDVNGLVKWEVTLATREKKEYRIEYTLDYPADFIQRNAVAANQPAAVTGMGGAMMPSAANQPPVPERSIYFRINSLEESIKK